MSRSTRWRPTFWPWPEKPSPTEPPTCQRLRDIAYSRPIPGIFQATAASFLQIRGEARNYLLSLGITAQPDSDRLAVWEERIADSEHRDQRWQMQHQRISAALERQRPRLVALSAGPYRESCSGPIERAVAAADQLFALLDHRLVEQGLDRLREDAAEAERRIDLALQAQSSFRDREFGDLLAPSRRYSPRIARDQDQLDRLQLNASSARNSGNYDVLIRDDRAIGELSARLERSIRLHQEFIDQSLLHWLQLCESWDAFRKYFGKRINQVQNLNGTPQFPAQWARLAEEIHYYILSAATKAGNADQTSIRKMAGLHRRQLKWNRPPGLLFREPNVEEIRGDAFDRWIGEHWIEPGDLQRLATIVDGMLASASGTASLPASAPEPEDDEDEPPAVPLHRLLP